jgi:hypothetical protein
MMDNDHNFGCGTWKVRTLFKAISLKALTQQLQKYKMQITAVQETKWIGNETWDTKTHNVLERKVKWEKGIWSCIYCKQGNEEEYT